MTVWDASDGSISARSARFRPDGGPVRATFSADAKYVFLHDGAFVHTLTPGTLRPAYPAIPLPMDSGALVAHPDGSLFVTHRYTGSFSPGGSAHRRDPRQSCGEAAVHRRCRGPDVA